MEKAIPIQKGNTSQDVEWLMEASRNGVNEEQTPRILRHLIQQHNYLVAKVNELNDEVEILKKRKTKKTVYGGGLR